MKVYKFRYGQGDAFKYALYGLRKNYFWASKIEDLNDPFESMVGTRGFDRGVSLIGELFNAHQEDIDNLKEGMLDLKDRREVGIFALSKSVTNELLWAYYGDSHRGFCIEYELDDLMIKRGHVGRYKIDVKYSKGPGSISFWDPINSDETSIFQKLFGTKSKA